MKPKPGKIAYRVYFSQVNQTCWNIEAKSREEAIKMAIKYWKEAYGNPTGVYIEIA